MAKPVIKSMSPFDGKLAFDVNFTYSGNQPYKNRVIIYDASTLSVVYDSTISSMQLKHQVPANSLTNGKQYAVTAQCFDADGTGSAVSEKSFFWCFTTPTFAFSGLSSGDTIQNASYVASAFYQQSENEKLSQTIFHLYNANKVLLTSSSIIYGSENITYQYSGFNNQTNYFLRMTGQTEHGMNIETDYIRIFVKYSNPSQYAMLLANEDKTGTGTVNYWTNINIINPTRDDYTVSNGELDLTNDYITYNTGFDLGEDYKVAIRHKFFSGKFLTMSNDKGEEVSLSLVQGDDENHIYMLSIGDINIFSDPIFFDDAIEYYTVYIVKKGNLYGLYPFYDSNEPYMDCKIKFSVSEPTNLSVNTTWINSDTYGTLITEENIKITDVEPTDVPSHTIWIGGDE